MGKEHILIVDDDERVLLVLRRALQVLGDGFDVVGVRGGREALERAEETPFDLLITDLIMPGVDGMELTEKIRARNPDLAVIWMTSYGSHQFKDEMEQFSVDVCLEKPMWIDEFRQAVVDVLDSRAKSGTGA